MSNIDFSAYTMDHGLANAIAEFSPVEEEWRPLDDLLERVFSSHNPAAYYAAIFNLFERFPESDGAGVFWSALHGMEAVGGYEAELLRFYRRWPSEMTTTMLVRLKNSGCSEIEGMPIDPLIDTAAR